MQELNAKLIQQYLSLSNSYENVKINELENAVNDKVVCFEYGARPKDLAPGVVIGTKRNAEGKIMVYQTSELMHSLVFGPTGIGKTQGYMFSTLLSANGQNSYIVMDPKGELCSGSYNKMCSIYGKENVLILNFSSPDHTLVKTNPFQVLAEKYLSAKGLPKKQREQIREEVYSDLIKKVNNLFEIRSEKDASWDEGARSLITGIFAGLIEDCDEANLTGSRLGIRRKMTPKEVNFGQVVKVFSSFKWNEELPVRDAHFFSSRDQKAFSVSQSAAAMQASALGTRTSYFSLVATYLEPYRSVKVSKILEENTLDILSLSKTPKVLYIIFDVSDSIMKKVVNDTIVNLLHVLLNETHDNVKALDTPVIFLCDEFASLTPNSVYTDILAIGRASNIFLSIIIQSYSQLKVRYREDFDTIKENCNCKIFLGSNETDTCRTFIDDLGKRSTIDELELLTGRISVVLKPVITMEKIMYNLERGEGYVKIMQQYPIHSNFVMCYQTPEFNELPKFDVKTITAKSEDITQKEPEPTAETIEDAQKRRREENIEKLIKYDQLEERKKELIYANALRQLTDREFEVLYRLKGKSDFISITFIMRSETLGYVASGKLFDRYVSLGLIEGDGDTLPKTILPSLEQFKKESIRRSIK